MRTLFVAFLGMLSVGNVPVSGAWAQANGDLYHVHVKDLGYDIEFTEIERGENYSIAEVVHKEGTSVGSSMVLLKCKYDIAKERGSEYFFTVDLGGDSGSMRMKIFFSNNSNVELKELVGAHYSLEVQEAFDDRGFTAVSDFASLFDFDEFIESIPKGGLNSDGLYQNVTSSGDRDVDFVETERGPNYSTIEIGVRDQEEEIDLAYFALVSVCELLELRAYEYFAIVPISSEGEYPITERVYLTNDENTRVEELVKANGHHYDPKQLQGIDPVESVASFRELVYTSMN